MAAMEELGGYLSSPHPSQPSPVQPAVVASVAGGGASITYMEAMVPMSVPPQQQPPPATLATVTSVLDMSGADSRCILCDSYISSQAEPPAGINIHGFRLPSTQETLSDKLESVLQPVCGGTTLHDATTMWQMKHICMACSAALMTLDTYETKILEIRDELSRRFMDVMKLRAPHYGPLQPTYDMSSHSQVVPSSRGAHSTGLLAASHSSVPGVMGGALISSHAAATNGQAASSSTSSCSTTAGADARSGQFVCNICHKSFRNRYNLKRHAGMHTGLRPFSCAHCDRTFRQKDHLKTHLRAGSGDAPLVCNLCGASFACFTQMSEHRRRLHQELGENGCRHCDQVFSTPTELRRHTRQAHPHPVRAEFRCAVCGRAFPNGYNLRRHERTHSGERPFGCDVCGKRFTQLCILKKHELVHQKRLPNVGELIVGGTGEDTDNSGGSMSHHHHQQQPPSQASTPGVNESANDSPQQTHQTGVPIYMD